MLSNDSYPLFFFFSGKISISKRSNPTLSIKHRAGKLPQLAKMLVHHDGPAEIQRLAKRIQNHAPACKVRRSCRSELLHDVFLYLLLS